MTYIIGMKFDSGVVLAADCRVTLMGLGLSTQQRKIDFSINQHASEPVKAFFLASYGILDDHGKSLLLSSSRGVSSFDRVHRIHPSDLETQADVTYASAFLERAGQQDKGYILLRLRKDEAPELLQIKGKNVYRRLHFAYNDWGLGVNKHTEISNSYYLNWNNSDLNWNNSETVTRKVCRLMNNALSDHENFQGYQLFRVTLNNKGHLLEACEDLDAIAIPSDPFRQAYKTVLRNYSPVVKSDGEESL